MLCSSVDRFIVKSLLKLFLIMFKFLPLFHNKQRECYFLYSQCPVSVFSLKKFRSIDLKIGVLSS